MSEDPNEQSYEKVRLAIVVAVKAFGPLLKLGDIKFQQKPSHVWFWIDQKNGVNTAKTPLQLETSHIKSGGLDGNQGITYKSLPRVIEALWRRQIAMVRREKLTSRKKHQSKIK